MGLSYWDNVNYTEEIDMYDEEEIRSVQENLSYPTCELFDDGKWACPDSGEATFPYEEIDYYVKHVVLIAFRKIPKEICYKLQIHDLIDYTGGEISKVIKEFDIEKKVPKADDLYEICIIPVLNKVMREIPPNPTLDPIIKYDPKKELGPDDREYITEKINRIEFLLEKVERIEFLVEQIAENTKYLNHQH